MASTHKNAGAGDEPGPGAEFVVGNDTYSDPATTIRYAATRYRDAFMQAIADAGLTPPAEIDDDGELHRFSTNGRPGDLAGWYILHGDGIPAGAFGDWREGLVQNWRFEIGRKLTDHEAKAHRARVVQMRQAREAAEREGHEAAAAKAEAMWQAAKPVTAASDHPYLARKQAAVSEDLRLGDDGWLLVPMRDPEGRLWNVERIAPERPADGIEKKGLFRGRRTGLFHPFGEFTASDTLLLAEGYATGNSLWQAASVPVAVAFNAGNLTPVAKALKGQFPDHLIIICADDDYRTKGNPGLTKARQAAAAVGALVAVPDFGPDRPEGATDWNDLHLTRGLAEVGRQIAEVVCVARGEEPEQATPNPEPDTQEAAPAFPPPNEVRPCYRVLDDWHEGREGRRYRPGVYHCTHTPETERKEASSAETWVCSPLHVDAVTFDGQECNYGRLLRFLTTLKRWRTWAMPMEMLRGAGDELRGELLAMGVTIDPRCRGLLAEYLQQQNPKRRMTCAMQTGWASGSFVLPDVVIGPTAGGVIFQSGERGHDEYTLAGDLAGWRDSVAAMATGNPLLLVAISVAFTGPLLGRCHAESGGVHFHGDSSTGKTTLIDGACSVHGGPNFRRSWRATANGLEGAAALFNDSLLALDEISECDPREIGAIVYALGNGRGKQRASRSGAARSVVRWRCALLSSGERSLGTAMEEGGKTAKAGQAVRLLDVPAARTYGCWDDLHGLDSGSALSDHIKRAAVTHHGHAGRAYLERLTRETRDLAAFYEEFKAMPSFVLPDAEGQEKRAAARFALFALAGELATEYGITGWPEGAAVRAAGLCFELWRGARGKGNDERRQIAELVLAFIDRHGDSRFSSADHGDQAVVRDRAGWWREGEAGRQYLFTAGAMKEAVKGIELRRALDVLVELGALPKPGASGERAVTTRLDGRPVKVYPIDPGRLAGGGHGY